MRTAAILAVATLALGTMLWAADDAVIEPQQGATTIAPVTKDVVSSTDAITIPQILSYQGRLTDATGVPVPNGNYSVAFKLYTVPSGDSPFWSETQSVTTRDGLFSVLLGSVKPITTGDGGPGTGIGAAYLSMAVDGDAEMAPRLRIAGTANTNLTAGSPFGIGDSDWVRAATPDSVLYTFHRLGIVKGQASNKIYGPYGYTMTNFGSSCTTGTNGGSCGNIAIGGGYGNHAWAPFTTVCGGRNNRAGDQATDTAAIVVGGYGNAATGRFSYVPGGQNNTASGDYAAVGGGYADSANASNATVGGGYANSANASNATVGGGYTNKATDYYASVVGGYVNTASGYMATIGGGGQNTASSDHATVGGGLGNTASASYATVAGGVYSTASGYYGFAAGGYGSNDGGYANSAAFNGQTATQANELRCDILNNNSLVFTCDDPRDPSGKLLNQYGMGSSELVMFYRGAATIGSDGRVQVQLPDYFDAYTRNPMVQLTGVGTSDVYVSEEVSGNHFVVGGKPGTKVFWTVTGERKDVNAEIARILLPVEQPKTGALRDVMVDDDGLAGAMQALEKLGKAGEFSFRTAAGRQRYENMLKQLREAKQHKSAQPELQHLKATPQPHPSMKLPQPPKGQKQPEQLPQPQKLQQQ